MILADFNLSSANALNLDQSRILSFGKELNQWPACLAYIADSLNRSYLLILSMVLAGWQRQPQPFCSTWLPAFSTFPTVFFCILCLNKADSVNERSYCTFWCSLILICTGCKYKYFCERHFKC